MSIEAMKQALEALDELLESFEKDGKFVMSSSIRNELFDRLTEVSKHCQAIAEAESKRAALDAIIKSSEKRNEEWDALSADEQAAYHAQNACPYCGGSGHKDDIAEAEKQEQGEPVAWGMEGKDGFIFDVICPAEHEREAGGYTTPLYTTPQQRTWVGLTDKDIDSMVEVTDLSGAYYYDDLYAVVRAAEAKLKEKNT